MAKSSPSSTGGIGFPGMLFAVVVSNTITLKLCGEITWSWWLVTLPIWGPFATTALLIVLLVVAVSLGARCLPDKDGER